MVQPANRQSEWRGLAIRFRKSECSFRFAVTVENGSMVGCAALLWTCGRVEKRKIECDQLWFWFLFQLRRSTVCMS